MKICGTCLWGQRVEPSKDHPGTFECHKQSPGANGWPKTLCHDTCGAYQPDQDVDVLMQDNGFKCVKDLDASGLKPSEFRVIMHLLITQENKLPARSIDEITKICKINKKTIYSALLELETNRMIKKTSIPGHPSKYSVRDSAWWHK